MKALAIGLALSLAVAGNAAAQDARPSASDEQSQKLATQLGDCIAAKVSAEDKPQLAKWIALEISAAPLLAGVVTIDAAKREELDKAAAKIFTRLVVSDCSDVAKQLMQADSRAGFRTAGAALGRLAIREMMASPGVNAGVVRSYVARLNQEDFRALVAK